MLHAPGLDRSGLRPLLSGTAVPLVGRLTRLCPHCGSTAHGRPRAPGRHVSLGYADGLALLAAAACGPIGVDVERAPRDGVDLDAWTRAEALAKAAGTGLREAGFDARPDAVALALDLPVPGYRAALAVPAGTSPVVRIRTLPREPPAGSAAPSR